jgi:hypothetical protein
MSRIRYILTNLPSRAPYTNAAIVYPKASNLKLTMRDLETDKCPVERKPTEHVLPEQDVIDAMFDQNRVHQTITVAEPKSGPEKSRKQQRKSKPDR